MGFHRVAALIVVSVQAATCIGDDDVPPASTHIESVAAFYGITRDDLRYFPNDLFDCVREYASLQESRDVMQIRPIDEADLLKGVSDRLALEPSLVAVGVLGTACFGAVHQRGATGMYEVFRQSGSVAGGKAVGVIGGIGVPPAVQDLDDPANLGILPLDEDYLIIRRDADGNVKIRETYTLTDGENVGLFTGEWRVKFDTGSWDDYIAGRAVSLSIPESEARKRSELYEKFLATPEVKEYFRLAAAAGLAETSAADAGEEPTLPDLAGMEVTATRNHEPQAIHVFVKGDFLLWLDTGLDVIRYEVRRNETK